MKDRQPHRTLKRAVRLSDMTIISSDDLLETDADSYQEIRRSATRARNKGSVAFSCEKCGHAVYAPREPSTKKAFWKHHKGAPQNCPWWTGNPNSIDEISGAQFQGAQESPLHSRLKNLVADILRDDPHTEPDSVVVDEYVFCGENRRKPDVRAVYDGKPIAIEIQLSTTQIPIIVAREDFYRQEGRHLIWVTWNFEPVERTQMLTAFEDIFYSHSKNLFSLDDKVIVDSQSKGVFQLRVFWEGEIGWNSKVISLKDLFWPESGLPFAVAPSPAWHIDFRQRWLAATPVTGMDWQIRRVLLAELANKLRVDSADGIILEEEGFEGLLNAILSFVMKKPVGSKQLNLKEVINTFLSSPSRHRFARLMRKVIISTEGQAFFDTTSVYEKFTVAERERQDDPQTMTGRVALLLFPELFTNRLP